MLLYFLISLIATTVGAFSGLGGGLLIKPAMDAVTRLEPAQINFLSGCTVLCMACINLVSRRHALKEAADSKLALLAVASALGGVTGKVAFDMAGRGLDTVLLRVVQSAMIGLLCAAILLYMVRKAYITTLRVESRLAVFAAGLGMGLLSAFLGIGGGPFNVLVLGYLFSMESRKAALSSIFIILCAQGAGLVYTLATAIPVVQLLTLALMAVGGCLGGLLGAFAAKRATEKQTELCFSIVMGLVLVLSMYNVLGAVGG